MKYAAPDQPASQPAITSAASFLFSLGASARVERSARTVATDRPPQEYLHAKQNITRLLFFLIIPVSVHPPPLPATTSTPLPFPVMAMTEAAQLDHVESGVIAGMIFFITQHPPTKPQHPPTKPARSPPPSLSADGNRLVRLCSSLASYTVTPVLPYRPSLLFPPEGSRGGYQRMPSSLHERCFWHKDERCSRVQSLGRCPVMLETETSCV